MEDKQNEVLEQYDFVVEKKIRARGAFLLETSKGVKLLKEFEGSEKHFDFENKIKLRLKEEGFNYIDFVVPNKEGLLVTKNERGEAFFVCDWYRGEECNSRKASHLYQAGVNLAKLHVSMHDIEGKDQDQEYPDDSLLVTMSRHNREIKRIYTYMKDKKRKNEFEIYAMEAFAGYYEQAIEGEELLSKSKYYEQVKQTTTVCHGSYNYHNIILLGNETTTTNFEKAYLGAQMTDLYYFLRKTLEKNQWDMAKGNAILDGYNYVRPISRDETEFLYINLLYPEKYWKLLNHYYNSKKA